MTKLPVVNTIWSPGCTVRAKLIERKYGEKT
jgi:hypothetical protein